MKRRPSWACSVFDAHGETIVCSACVAKFVKRGSRTEGWEMPPRAEFGRGWFGVGAIHWFDATDAALFPSKDGKRLLAQAVCGAICEMTLTWAPRAERECVKCLRALKKAGRLAKSKH